ncbi:aldehyde dehydrogenase family protein [Nguyenibacter sp. L1]|uniref:aldehyde dehydrogenase family protein n=1 Tax=Nguyenibacter sp. L1 TaxID=3049350 RepID=UPI002B4839E7|nr:aldehyde dehydrogenase family protein [Nguyenibacter sp. L1]WRH89318.1 aldehyde dehydrogenase family protein [Nguyenibacter sp. L1]
MGDILKNCIDGAWVASTGVDTRDIINPATGQVSGRLALSTTEDVERAVAAARLALAGYSRTSMEERATLLNRIAVTLETKAIVGAR